VLHGGVEFGDYFECLWAKPHSTVMAFGGAMLLQNRKYYLRDNALAKPVPAVEHFTYLPTSSISIILLDSELVVLKLAFERIKKTCILSSINYFGPNGSYVRSTWTHLLGRSRKNTGLPHAPPRAPLVTLVCS
jgi:hypothetical protein